MTAFDSPTCIFKINAGGRASRCSVCSSAPLFFFWVPAGRSAMSHLTEGSRTVNNKILISHKPEKDGSSTAAYLSTECETGPVYNPKQSLLHIKVELELPATAAASAALWQKPTEPRSPQSLESPPSSKSPRSPGAHGAHRAWRAQGAPRAPGRKARPSTPSRVS